MTAGSEGTQGPRPGCRLTSLCWVRPVAGHLSAVRAAPCFVFASISDGLACPTACCPQTRLAVLRAKEPPHEGCAGPQGQSVGP